jgi:two-component system, OmpR family, response regulator
MRILLVEDELEMAGLIVRRLESIGFGVDCAATIGAARNSIGARPYSLVLLDRRLPDGDGLSMVDEIKRAQPGVRVVMLTALDSVPDKIAGLDAGADDYLAKPFDVDELLARVRANLRRNETDKGAQPPLTVGEMSFDLAAREACVSGRPIVLHRRELALLESLLRRHGRAAPREALIEEVYGGSGGLQSNALDALVSRLRQRLNAEGAGVEIHPVRGVGYVLNVALT